VGLDISAVSRAAGNYLGPDVPDDLEDDQVHVYSTDGLDRLDGYEPGVYRVEGDEVGFRAGSYSGYNYWRRHLCRMALGVEPEEVWEDADAYRGRPFVELIDFSDCEGSIGPRTSRKLAADFQAFADRAEAYAREQGPDAADPNAPPRPPDDVVHNWWLENYREWQHAFELASDDGFVLFH
jgi:hypothetical protein